MTARVLPKDEWHRLPGDVPVASIATAYADPQWLVVEEEGRIVARWLLTPMLHAELLWIAPDRRKSPSIGRRLLQLMRETARTLGFSFVWAASESAEVTTLLVHPRVGAIPVPVLPFLLPVKES